MCSKFPALIQTSFRITFLSLPELLQIFCTKSNTRQSNVPERSPKVRCECGWYTLKPDDSETWYIIISYRQFSFRSLWHSCLAIITGVSIKRFLLAAISFLRKWSPLCSKHRNRCHTHLLVISTSLLLLKWFMSSVSRESDVLYAAAYGNPSHPCSTLCIITELKKQFSLYVWTDYIFFYNNMGNYGHSYRYKEFNLFK